MQKPNRTLLDRNIIMRQLYGKVLSLSGTYALGGIVQKALGIFLLPLYTSYLYPKDYGIVALMTITISLITITISSPINSAFGRFYYKPEYRGKREVFLFNIFFLLTIQSVVLTILYWHFSEFVCSLLFNNQEFIYIVRLCTIAIFLNPISSFLQALIKLREMARYFVFLSLSNFVLSCGLVVYLLVVQKLGVLAIFYGMIFDYCFRSVMCISTLVRHSKFELSLSILKEPLKYGYPAMLAGYSHFLIQSGDRYVLRILGSISNVGLYSFGYKIASNINMILVEALKPGLQPVVLKNENNPSEQKQFLRNSASYYYLAGLFLVLGLSLFAKEAIMLLARREEFWSSWAIVPIISFSYLQHGLGNFIGTGLVMKKKAYHISGIMFVSAITNIGLNFLFIPHWGILGAAFATLMSYIVWNWLKIYYSAKFYSLHFNLRRLGHITLVGVGLYLTSLFIANTGSLPLDMGIKFLTLLAYPLIFFMTKFFTSKEKEYMQKAWIGLRKNGLRESYAKIKAI